MKIRMAWMVPSAEHNMKCHHGQMRILPEVNLLSTNSIAEPHKNGKAKWQAAMELKNMAILHYTVMSHKMVGQVG